MTQIDRSEWLARRIRNALGRHNDERKGVEPLVEQVVAALDARVSAGDRPFYEEKDIDALMAERDRLRGLLERWQDIAVHCSIASGVCCCGDDMDRHTPPMDCGHTPVDHGQYCAEQILEDTRAALAEREDRQRGPHLRPPDPEGDDDEGATA